MKLNDDFQLFLVSIVVKDSDECELNCLAKGHKFFLRLLPKVKDGTPCFSDLKKVCIDGTCKVCTNRKLVFSTE